ncbi:protein ABHD11 [Pimephales promelas]|uniref:protein ABHD11 n=1 Tax=Pimephales promelas TaxID=90988 RepID=UPI001955C840|nr:protein ABHD11 [Pimephales promelas]KAG1940618.1 protein ABHD11 [Pimephales promelas]KAG1940619.1 protein ABHD11 [Pimephales promelas]KAG1940620.1 protein ABHD11 [Pimephales promelas]
MSNFAMSALCRNLIRGVLCAPSTCLSVTGFRDFCSGVSRLRAASAVNLTYDVFDGTVDSTPLVFLHGLFGSKSNFYSIAKSLVQRTGRKVLTVDARNHGKSPHSPVLTYETMTYDLTHLLGQLHIGKCVLIGHSMGGKVAMTTALSQPDLVERLVVVDISPSQTSARTNFHAYIQAMKEVKIASDIPRSTARRLAEDQLRKIVKERSVRQFLLTNLEEQNGDYGWRINLEAISNHLEDMMAFPDFKTTYEGPTLFLGGSSSAYISSEDYPEILRLFPSADIQYIPDASHWIHADKPLDFISSIITFLQS